MALAFICVASVLAWIAARNHDFVQVLLAIPFVGSLLAALAQIIRDQAAHEKALLLQEAGNRFVLGVGSHMGNVAFNKHVEFSQAYITEAQGALRTLVREGPCETVLNHASKLYEVRQAYIIWLTVDLEQSLDPFEIALREIGSNACYVKEVRGDIGHREERSKALEKMYNDFARVMGFKQWDGVELTDDLAVVALVRKIRSILGIEEITSLRLSILKNVQNEFSKKR